VLTGRRFVIGGLSYLTVLVAQRLSREDAEVVVVGSAEADDEAREVVNLLGDSAKVIDPGVDRDQALLDAGLVGATVFLALAEDDLDNLRFVADAHVLAPEVPCVLRTFQPELADAVAEELNIRRAYSVAALSAPAIVAAALGERVVETLRIGEAEVPLCVLEVHDRSPLASETADDINHDTKCAVIAVKRKSAGWQAALPGDATLAEGDQVLVGGRQDDVMALALDNEHLPKIRRRHRQGHWRQHGIRQASLLRVSVVLFMIVVIAAIVVNFWVVRIDFVDAVNGAVGAALGNTPPPTQFDWVKWFDLAATIAGVILLWVLLSHVTALVLAERLEVRMTKRARRMRNHVVVVGLGKVGYRVVQLLAELKVPTVAIEQAPNSTFMEAVAVHTPVLTGDGALLENLQRTGIDRARCVIACTNDDLANLATSVEARRLNPTIRTVTRAFDETVAERLGRAFQADVVLSSNRIASTAFVGAAVDVLAMRPIVLGDLDLLAFRVTPAEPIDSATLQTWRAKGLRVLAIKLADGTIEPPTKSLTHDIRSDQEAIVVGPDDVVRAFATAFE
jgi:Trk K+ transport system NAD-binding subunit